MIKPSKIESNHHYYVFFFTSSEVSGVDDLVKILNVKKSNHISLPNFSQEIGDIRHVQIEIDDSLGSPNVLETHKTRAVNGKQYYAYDLYLGSFLLGNQTKLFIAYPYKSIDKYFRKNFPVIFSDSVFYKPDVNVVLDYIRNRPFKEGVGISYKKLSVDIIKYTAEINERILDNAKKMNLIGENPINSRVFEILINSDEVSINPLSLKLRCRHIDIGQIEVIFDRYGNYRFWIPKNEALEKVSMLSVMIHFFKEINALYESEYITSHNATTDDD